MHRGGQDQRRRQSGFTLVELGIVLAIFAILVAIAVPSYTKMVNRARDAEAMQGWSMVKTELWSYFVQHGKYPTIPSDKDWWDEIDQPDETHWTFSGEVDGAQTTATVTAEIEGGGRKLCWSIDSQGTVMSGSATSGDCTPQ